MLAREAARVLRRQRQAVLEAVNRLVLGAVIAKHALDIGHEADEPHVQHEDAGAQDAVDDVPGNHVLAAVVAHDEVRHKRRHEDEQCHAQHDADDHGDAHPPRDPALVLFGRIVGMFLGALARGGFFSRRARLRLRGRGPHSARVVRRNIRRRSSAVRSALLRGTRTV